MVLGLSTRMLYGKGRGLLWSVDDIYDSSLQEVVNLSKKYDHKIEKLSSGFEGWHGREKSLVSMRYFTQFVCYEVAQTLRPLK